MGTVNRCTRPLGLKRTSRSGSGEERVMPDRRARLAGILNLHSQEANAGDPEERLEGLTRARVALCAPKGRTLAENTGGSLSSAERILLTDQAVPLRVAAMWSWYSGARQRLLGSLYFSAAGNRPGRLSPLGARLYH